MRAWLAIGSNLGDRAATLSSALDALVRLDVHVHARSSVYSTDPVPPGQPSYLNQVIEVAFDGAPRDLLTVCQIVEAAHGRDRAREERWGPRTLDIDILVIEGTTVREEDLVVPHASLHERAFVLVPLAEIAPDLEVPGHGTARDLAAAAGDAGVRRLDGL